MIRLTACLTCLLGLPALAAAQGVVVAAYPAPVVTTYYAPAPVVSYYAPAPVVTAYAAPTVSYYRSPDVVTYRHPLMRPRATVVRIFPGATVAAPAPPVVTASYPPVYVP